MGGSTQRGSLGTNTNSKNIDKGTNTRYASPLPGPIGGPTSVLVAAPVLRRMYHPGVIHEHKPCGRWTDIQDNPDSGIGESALCKISSPMELVTAAILAKFRDKPIALEHLRWYLKGGGITFREDLYLHHMLLTDRGVQDAIRKVIGPKRSSGIITRFLKIDQSDYEDQDLRFAFGAIDRLDVETNFDTGTVHAWFQDRYEWHPYYPGLYSIFPDDGARSTNCVHAALVELKATGAADFWMQGEATVPLGVIAYGGSFTRGGDSI